MSKAAHKDPARKAALGALLDRPKEGPAQPAFIRAAPARPPGGRHRDSDPAARLMVVGLLVILILILIAQAVWKREWDKHKPPVPPKNMPMIHLRSGA